MDDIHSWWEVPSIAHFCSLFRVSFDLLDFDIEDLEAALLTDGTEDNGNSLLQELIARLLSGCLGNNSISTFNYQMFLRRLFREKCKEYNFQNPFNSDIDFQFLPLRTKVEILHALCDFRLDADDVMESLKNLDSDSLRVHPLGYDENKSAYWYFYGTRLYREDYEKVVHNKKKKKKRGRKKKIEPPLCSDVEEDELDLGSGKWQVVCFTESDWERLALNTEDSDNRDVQALHQVITEDFLPEIPRLFEEKERLQRKRMLEMQPRRQSTRLEKLKQQKEERKKYEDICQVNNDKLKKKENRKKKLEKQPKVKEDANIEDSDAESHGYSSSSSKKTCRQTNNSLASATGQIVIEASQHKPETKTAPKAGFKSSSEDLQIGMYKILNKLKDHEDAWPFLEPVDEEIAPSYYRVVKTPMDLQQMEDKLNDDLYQTFSQFKHDFQLIIANCKQYNGSTNEYSVMCGNLQRVFNIGVHKYLDWEMSEESDDEMAYLKRYENGTMRSRISRNRQRSTSSKESSNNTDKENEEKLRECLESSKFENSINQTDDDSCSLDSKLESKKKDFKAKEMPKLKKSVMIKNTSAIEVQALEEVTEQTLRDINKWLDDTPSFSSASNSPMATVAGSVLDDAEVTSRLDAEYRQAHKLDKPRLLFKEKKRPAKESIVLPVKRKREIQRTIDRLQPGKSKGNLISNKPDDNQSIAKQKLVRSDLETGPTLSLGTVLNTDLMGFSSKRSSEDKDLEKNEEEPEKCPNDEKNIVKKEEIKTTEVPEEKPEKATPNLSAWFKAFGAPKTQPTPKRKQETVETSPLYTAYAMNDMLPYDYTLKDTDKKENLSQVDNKKIITPIPSVSPDKTVSKRQRKTSTGSSVSEQSSQNDSWNSPRPSLDESYLSPQSGNSPQQLKPYQNVLNIPHAPIKVGFYQDAFARPNSEKSSSCSPRNPSSVVTVSPHGQSPHGQSPHQTFTSPCDIPNDSPGNFAGSPHDASCSPHNNIVNSPKESPHHLILSPQDSSNSPYYSPHNIVNSPKEPVASLADDYQQNQNVYSQYIGSQQSSPQNTYTELYPQQQQPVTSAPSKTQNIFPVKKRVYNEDERPQEIAFTPTVASKEQERVFVPTPGQMPNSNFNSELNYSMAYSRNDQTLPPYQQNAEHQHPSVPVTYQNSLNYLQIAREQPDNDQKNVSNSIFNYTAPNSTFVSAPAPHYTSTPLNYSNPSKDAVGYTTASLNYGSRTTSGQFMPPDYKQPTTQQRLNYNNPYEQYPDQMNLRPYNYPVLPSKSYPHPIQEMIPNKPQNIDFTTGRPLPNLMPGNIAYRYNQPTYPGPPSVAEMMKNKMEMSQPTYSSPTMAEMIKANQPTYVNPAMADMMKANQPPGYPPNSSVAEMTKSKMEINRSLMMEPVPTKPAKKTSKKKKAAAQKSLPPPPQAAVATVAPPAVMESPKGVDPSRTDPSYAHHYPPLVKPPISTGPFNFNPAIKDGYQDYLNDIRSTGYFADPAAAVAAAAAAAAAQTDERNPAYTFARPPSGYAPPPLEAYNPPNPSDIYSQLLQRHPMMLHQGLTGFPPPSYLNMHDPMNRHPPWM